MQVDKPRSVNQKKYIKRKKRQTFEEINLSECGPNLTETYACLTQCYINQNVIYFQCVAAGIPEATCLATYEKDLNECFYNVINSITVNENLCVPFYYWSKYRDPEGTGGGGTEDRVQTCFNTLRYMSVMFMSIALSSKNTISMINYCQMLENNPKLSISVLPSLERLVITDLRYSTTLLINITSKGLGIVTLEKDQSNHLTSRMSSTTSGRISQTTLFLVGNMVYP